MAHRLSTSDLIAQSDSSIHYPGTSKSAFTDEDFFYPYCGKSGAGGTIAQYGCPICCVAMFLMYKGAIGRTNDAVFYTVKEATLKATDNAADLLDTATFTAKIFSKCIPVHFHFVSDLETELRNKRMCIVRLLQGGDSHYVLADGYDDSQSNLLDWCLVADSAGGVFRTLRQAMAARGMTQSTATISTIRVIY